VFYSENTEAKNGIYVCGCKSMRNAFAFRRILHSNGKLQQRSLLKNFLNDSSMLLLHNVYQLLSWKNLALNLNPYCYPSLFQCRSSLNSTFIKVTCSLSLSFHLLTSLAPSTTVQIRSLGHVVLNFLIVVVLSRAY
jgi:hypothetical protein